MTTAKSDQKAYPVSSTGVADLAATMSAHRLTSNWGEPSSVSSYLNRCQVDTPADVVVKTWEHIRRLRSQSIDKVVDFGAGDARFAVGGTYRSYIGFEIDAERCVSSQLPENARLVNRCAFSELITDADVCIGNPPFVRNQDIPTDWRVKIHTELKGRTGVHLSGLANAWQYFFLHSLASLKDDGLAALIIPFEWISRPASRALRSYIHKKRWNVYVYRLRNAKFARVLTTASITLVDKANREGKWEFYDESTTGVTVRIASPTGDHAGVLEYCRATTMQRGIGRAKRGLSPGTQAVLTLTEAQRRRNKLSIDRDVVACVTSLRWLPDETIELDEAAFQVYYVAGGRRCWLVRSDVVQSTALRAYLSSVPSSIRQSKTCMNREDWWRFKMPEVPSMLLAQGFRGKFPKTVKNAVNARAVGGVCGIYDVIGSRIETILEESKKRDMRTQLVSYSTGFYKMEINQINALLKSISTSVVSE